MPSDTAQTAAVTATPNTIEELLAIFEAVAPSIPSIVNAAATGEGGLTKIVNVGALLVNALSNVHSALSTALPAA